MEEVARAGTGLILGKFMPPHRGHLRLVRAALERVRELTIVVASLPGEPIPGEQRVRWMRALVPEARVLHLTDQNPSHPRQHPDFWELWVRSMRRLMPEGPQLLFAGEDYGAELARRLGAGFVRVDREEDGVSATAIRADPLGRWEDLPEVVRPCYVRRVVLTGSECTGKTTLAAALARHYRTVWVPEWARGYVDRLDHPLGPADVEPIARGQRVAEDQAALQANRLLILDTNVLSTQVYGEHYYRTVPEFIPQALSEHPAHLYLLCDIDLDWVADRQRDRGDRREEMQSLFRAAVIASGVPWVEIRGTGDERLRAAVAAIDARFGI